MQARIRRSREARKIKMRAGCPRSPARLASELLPEQLLTASQAILRQHHGLRFADGVEDQALFVETGQGVPVEAFPSPALVVEGEVEEGEDGVIDLVVVDIHFRILPNARVRASRRVKGDAGTNKMKGAESGGELPSRNSGDVEFGGFGGVDRHGLRLRFASVVELDDSGGPRLGRVGPGIGTFGHSPVATVRRQPVGQVIRPLPLKR